MADELPRCFIGSQKIEISETITADNIKMVDPKYSMSTVFAGKPSSRFSPRGKGEIQRKYCSET